MANRPTVGRAVKTRSCAEVFRAGVIRLADRSHFVPGYRHHKQSGQAIVTLPDGLGGRCDVLLGKHGTRASRVEYARILAEWEAGGRRLPPSINAADLTINELILAF